MKLYMSVGSPFVRKCRIVAREKGLMARFTEVPVDFPYKSGADFLQTNPVGQVPALLTDEGESMSGSPLICAYLDSLGSGPRLLPPEGPDHWRSRRMEALADGILEMTVKTAMERRRPENEQSATWIGHWTDGLNRALDQAEFGDLDPDPLDLGKIALAVVGAYIDFRRPELNWRGRRPRLSQFADRLEERTSFEQTRPQ